MKQKYGWNFCSKHNSYMNLKLQYTCNWNKAVDSKTYKHFYIYRFRVTELQNFCDKSNIDYKQEVLNEGSMNFLPLIFASGQILEMHNLWKSHLQTNLNDLQWY